MEATNDYKTNLNSKSNSPLEVDKSGRRSQSDFESHFPMEKTLRQFKTKTEDAYNSSIQTVRKNPITSLAIAMGVGAAAGYLLKRK